MKKQLKNLIVLWIILLSGSVVFMHYYYNMFGIIATLIIVYLFSYKIYVIKLRFVSVSIVIIGLILGTVIIKNSDFSSIGSYAHFFVLILLAASIPTILSFKEFRDIYLRIIYFLALTSLIIFPVIVLFRGIVILFPVISSYAIGSAYYYNLFLAVFHFPLQNFISNSSVFWEGGAYQAFLNIAIAFELLFFKFQHKTRLFVFILAVLSTFSTTGYIILLIQASIFLLFDKSLKIKRSNRIYRIILIIIMIGFLFSNIFITKVVGKFSDNNYSYYVRFSGTLTDLTIFKQSPLFGVGITDYQVLVKKIAANKFGLQMGVSANSFTRFLAIYGLLAFSFLLYYYYKFTYFLAGFNKKKRWIYFGLLIIIFSTENFYTSFLFLTFLFYGVCFKLENLSNENIVEEQPALS